MRLGISLGLNCASAVDLYKNGIRESKKNGYKTCVFDLMVSNLPGIIKCINDDFKYFCDLDYIQLKNSVHDFFGIPVGSQVLCNTYYNFVFTHESPGHILLFWHEKWPDGIDHYVKNGYAKFIERYTQRINNFKEYMNGENKIIFKIIGPEGQNLDELNNALKLKYPNLVFDLISENYNSEFFDNYTQFMKINEPIDQ